MCSLKLFKSNLVLLLALGVAILSLSVSHAQAGDASAEKASMSDIFTAVTSQPAQREIPVVDHWNSVRSQNGKDHRYTAHTGLKENARDVILSVACEKIEGMAETTVFSAKFVLIAESNEKWNQGTMRSVMNINDQLTASIRKRKALPVHSYDVDVKYEARAPVQLKQGSSIHWTDSVKTGTKTSVGTINILNSKDTCTISVHLTEMN